LGLTTSYGWALHAGERRKDGVGVCFVEGAVPLVDLFVLLAVEVVDFAGLAAT